MKLIRHEKPSRLLLYLVRVLPHITIILSVMLIVFCILDEYNPAMGFITSTLSKRLLLVYCMITLMNTILFVAFERLSFKHKDKE